MAQRVQVGRTEQVAAVAQLDQAEQRVPVVQAARQVLLEVVVQAVAVAHLDQVARLALVV